MMRSFVLLDTTSHGRGRRSAVRARSCSIASIPIALVLLVLQERRLESRSLSFPIFREIGCVLIKIPPPAKSETYRRSHLRQRASLPLEIAARRSTPRRYASRCFLVSEMTVSPYMPRRPAEPDQVKRWIAFLQNHGVTATS